MEAVDLAYSLIGARMLNEALAPGLGLAIGIQHRSVYAASTSSIHDHVGTQAAGALRKEPYEHAAWRLQMQAIAGIKYEPIVAAYSFCEYHVDGLPKPHSSLLRDNTEAHRPLSYIEKVRLRLGTLL